MRQFDKRYIEKELNNINNNISEHIDLYIFGGGAMSFFDLKDATKDIDEFVTTES